MDRHPNAKSNRVPLPNEMLALRSLVDAESAVLDTIKASLAKAVETTRAAQKRVVEAKLELEAAQSALSAAQDTAKTLEGLLTPVVASIEDKKALLHPIRRFPPELLFEIFQCVVEADEIDRRADSDLDGRWGPCDAPIILGSVCSVWRTVVQTRTSLWQYFNISLSWHIPKFISSQENSPFTNRLNLWAQLSADRKVDIAIRDIGDSNDPDGLRAVVMIRKVYAILGNRIRRLQLLFSGVGAISQILSPSVTGHTVPHLQQLTVHVAESVLPGIAYIPQGAFRSSLSSLESLQLRNIWWDQELNLPNLETFDIYNPDWRISPQQFLAIVKGCPKIREMPIEFEHKPTVNLNRLSRVQFDHLESLHTTCEWVSLAGELLCQYMSAPRVCNLQLYGRGDGDILAMFIRIVTPNVQHLHLGIPPMVQGVDEAPLDLVAILRAAPKLQDFAVDSVSVPATFFNTLSLTPLPPDTSPSSPPDQPNQQEGILGPLITTLMFKDVTFEDPDSVVRMVENRTRKELDGESVPRKLTVLEIQGGRDMGLSSWHERRIEELMMREDEPAEEESKEQILLTEGDIPQQTD